LKLTSIKSKIQIKKWKRIEQVGKRMNVKNVLRFQKNKFHEPLVLYQINNISNVKKSIANNIWIKKRKYYINKEK
jgi:hypothetical protein